MNSLLFAVIFSWKCRVAAGKAAPWASSPVEGSCLSRTATEVSSLYCYSTVLYIQSAPTYHDDSIASVSSDRRFARVTVTGKSLDEAWHGDLHPDISIRLSQLCGYHNTKPSALISRPALEESKVKLANVQRSSIVSLFLLSC